MNPLLKKNGRKKNKKEGREGGKTEIEECSVKQKEGKEEMKIQ